MLNVILSPLVILLEFFCFFFSITCEVNLYDIHCLGLTARERQAEESVLKSILNLAVPAVGAV